MFEYNNLIVHEDIKDIISAKLPWEMLNGKSVMVTGVNGMLACYLTYTILYLIEEKKMSITLIALTRSERRTKELFAPFMGKSYFKVLVQDVSSPIVYDGKIDYIFHLAGNANPTAINDDPVGIMKANLLGSFNVLEKARLSNTKRILFVSTREVYGAVNANVLTEQSFGSLNPMDKRSCYPESKRAAETIFNSYYNQFGIECVIARIAHCYGPGMKIYNDGRVMADFIGNAVRGENIVLHSSGEAVRAFIYLSDAIIGIFTIMLKGVAGEAYNLSNEEEPVSIYQVAELICDVAKEKNIQIVFSGERAKSGYCNYPRVGLDNTKIQNIGFKPSMRIKDGINRTLESFK